MKYQAKLTGALVLALAATLVVPMGAGAASSSKKKKTTTTKKKKTTAAPTTAAQAPAAAPAKSGGKIVYGVGAESNGWMPSTQNWAPEGTQVRWSVIENLMGVNSKGETVGYLAESATASSDYKTWTFKLRSGIKFHNGEAFNAEAVALNITEVQRSPLTGAALLNLAGCQPAGDLVVACAMRSAWVSFPVFLTGSLGAMVAPAMIKSKDATKPIGTGPFVFKSWTPNEKFVATKNPSWWRGAVAADEVEFRVILSDDARLAQLQSGQLNFSHTSAAVANNEYQAAAKGGKISIVDAEGPAQVNYDMLNNAAPPFNNKSCRLAAALALDVDTLIKLRAQGFVKANGVFSPGTVGNLKDNGNPGYNLDRSKEEYAKCKAANGGKDVEFTMATTTAPEAIETRNVKKQMVERAGFTIKTLELPQANYIPAALVGAYQWLTWRNHGGYDPDGERLWWHSETAQPICSTVPTGTPCQALNFARFKDATIDASFSSIRGNSDPVVRKKAAEDINQAFGEEMYIIPNWYSKWVLGQAKGCKGAEGFKLPNGDVAWNLYGGSTPAVGLLSCG
jgi:peptide/nickel transport system substrate-binding protein